jgi:hypothetical protein
LNLIKAAFSTKTTFWYILCHILCIFFVIVLCAWSE